MLSTIRKSAMIVAALGALALGGSALAGAASKSKSAGTTSSQTRADRQPLSSDVAAKVKAAALDKVPGATVLETESGGPNGAAYHAHIKTSGGTLQVVLVNSDFTATAVQADSGRGKRGGRGGGRGETPLTGATKQQVEAAVLAKYPGATIVRSETNGDTAAPYEAHIKTSAGKELEVHVNKDFAVVDASERP